MEVTPPCETDAEDMVLVVPEGLKHTWNARHCCEPAIKNGYDDVGFLCAIKRHLAAWWGERCIPLPCRAVLFACIHTSMFKDRPASHDFFDRDE